jgi:hypothetical protein
MQEAQQVAEAGAAAARQELSRYALESVAGVSAPFAAPGHKTLGWLYSSVQRLYGAFWTAMVTEAWPQQFHR